MDEIGNDEAHPVGVAGHQGTRARDSALMSGRLRRALETVVTESPRSRAIFFIRTGIVIDVPPQATTASFLFFAGLRASGMFAVERFQLPGLYAGNDTF
jgi:hypothetical protein